MVDVGAGMLAQTLDDEVDRHLERRFFLIAVVRPEREEAFFAAIPGHDPEQIFKAALEQGVAFHVEEHVSLVGRGQTAKPTTCIRVEPFN